MPRWSWLGVRHCSPNRQQSSDEKKQSTLLCRGFVADVSVSLHGKGLLSRPGLWTVTDGRRTFRERHPDEADKGDYQSRQRICFLPLSCARRSQFTITRENTLIGGSFSHNGQDVCAFLFRHKLTSQSGRGTQLTDTCMT